MSIEDTMNDLHNLVAADKPEVLYLVRHIARSAGAPPTSTRTHAHSAAAVQGISNRPAWPVIPRANVYARMMIKKSISILRSDWNIMCRHNQL